MLITKVPKSNLVSNFKIYTKSELADLIKVSIEMIEDFIDDGLVCINLQKEDIWGKEVKRYAARVRERNNEQKIPGQIYCPKCKKRQLMSENKVCIQEISGQVNKLGNSKLKLQGHCAECGTVCTTIDWYENLVDIGDIFSVEFL